MLPLLVHVSFKVVTIYSTLRLYDYRKGVKITHTQLTIVNLRYYHYLAVIVFKPTLDRSLSLCPECLRTTDRFMVGLDLVQTRQPICFCHTGHSFRVFNVWLEINQQGGFHHFAFSWLIWMIMASGFYHVTYVYLHTLTCSSVRFVYVV